MAIIKKTDLQEIGYYTSKGEQLTNFVFEITGVEYNKDSHAYLQIKATNNTSTFVEIFKINLSKPFKRKLELQLLDAGCYLFMQTLKVHNLLEIFLFEYECYLIQFKIQAKKTNSHAEIL